jgi:hypothetical protein
MPRLVHSFPKYRHHKASGRACVCINGKYRYLPDPYESAESRAAYWSLMHQLESGALPDADQGQQDAATPARLTVAEVIERFWDHARSYYRDQDGRPAGELGSLKYALRYLTSYLTTCAMYAADFKPSHLKAIRDRMVKRGLARKYINGVIQRIKHLFVWAGENEHVPSEVAGAVKLVAALKQGRSGAHEPPAVAPVSWSGPCRT